MARSAIRTLSFFSQWMAEVLRQPWLMASLVLGPFLVLLLFGQGEQVGAPRPRAVVVQPPAASAQSAPLAVVPRELSQYLSVVGTTSDLKQAEAALNRGAADLVVALPADPSQVISQGKHPQLQVFTNEIDPVRQSYADAYIRDQVAVLNQRTVQKAVEDARSSAGDVRGFVQQARQYLDLMQAAQADVAQSRQALQQLKSAVDPLGTALDRALAVSQSVPLFGLPLLSAPLDQLKQLRDSVDALKQTVDRLDAELARASSTQAPSPEDVQRLRSSLDNVEKAANQLSAIPPDVLSAPFTLDLKNVAPFKPTPIGFYAPSVLALLLQHLAVTLGALSMARIRLLGLMELFQTSPVRPSEVAVGHYLSYGSLCLMAGGLLVALLVKGLGVPIFGPPLVFVAVLLLLVLTSLGLGLVISMISTSEQQAAQVAMLTLVASVFFSGFLVSLDTILWPYRVVSYLLPATYAIRTLQDVMLRGVLRTPGDLGVLAIAALAFFAITVVLLRREFRPR